MKFLRKSQMKRIFQQVSNKRIGENAKEELGKETENRAKEVSEKAIELMKEEDKKTLKKRHIKKALKDS